MNFKWSHFVEAAFNTSENRFISCQSGNSKVTEGSISNSNTNYDGTLYQYTGRINTELVNFSRCQANRGSALYYLSLSESTQTQFCFIDSCHSTEYSSVYFSSFSAKLIRSNIINNSQTNTNYGIICLYSGSSHRLDIEDCIFDKNCQNGKGAYFCTNSEASIYIFRTISDLRTTHQSGSTIYTVSYTHLTLPTTPYV